MGNKVSVDVRVPGAKQATGEIKSVQDAFTRLQKGGTEGFKIGAAAAVTTKAFNLAGQAIGTVTDYLKNSADAFREDEVSVQALTTSLRANVDGWDGNTRAIDDRIKAGQELGFSDDEQRTALGKLVGAYGDVTKSLNVMRTAEDLARYSGVDLATATDVLVKVHAGNYRALKALGIPTKDIKNETEALAAVQKIASGQAADYAQTLTGKLVVAEEKANEASEKFGKTVARVEGVVLPAITDAVSRAADAFDVWQVALDGNSTSVEKNDTLINGLKSSMIADLPFVKEYIKQLEGQNKGYTEAGDSGARLGTKIDVVAQAMGDAAPDAKTLASRLQDIERAGNDAKSALGDLATTIEDDLFGKAINAGNESRLKQNIADLEKQAKAAKKGSPEFIQLTGEIARNRQELFHLHLEEAAKKGPEAAIAFLRSQKVQAGAAADEIGRLIAKYKALIGYQHLLERGTSVTRGGAGGPPGVVRRAAGGPVTAGEAYMVGENRPELFVPDQNGRIVANPSGATGGGMQMVPIPVPMSWTPSQQAAWVREAGPVMADYLKRRGL